jgi:hypothetical protein
VTLIIEPRDIDPEVDIEMEWWGSYICQVDEDDPHPEAIRLALHHYGNTVLEAESYLFPDPYLQVVDTEDGPVLCWFTEAIVTEEPERSVMKRARLRSLIVADEGERYGI